MNTSPLKPPTKRSRSPSSLLTPAKRRILRQEGCLESPLSEPKRGIGRGRALLSGGGINEPAGLATPVSFGTRSRHELVDTPFIEMVARKTRLTSPSPKKAASKQYAAPMDQSPKRRVIPDAQATPRHTAAPIMVPRELPPRQDPQSPHYPGFEIYYDTHIELPSTSSRYIPEVDMDIDRQAIKENVPPRKRTAKLLFTPMDIDPVITPREKTSTKQKRTSSPKTLCLDSPPDTPVAPRMRMVQQSYGKVRLNFNPGHIPPRRADRLTQKMALEQEVDEDACDESL